MCVVPGRWFALRVRQRRESLVHSLLLQKGLEPFLPCYQQRRRWADRWKTIEAPLFPGYVFCRFVADTRTPVLNTPGVIDIVRTGSDITEVDEQEILALQRVVSSRLQCEPWTYLTVGNTVQIMQGPLMNLAGILVEVKKAPRVLLSLTLLQRSVLVEIERDWIAPFPDAADLRRLPAVAPEWN
jgi:transcription antitermination factor NusG